MGVFTWVRSRLKKIHRGSVDLWVVDLERVGSFRDNRGTQPQTSPAEATTMSLRRADESRPECEDPRLPIARDQASLGAAETMRSQKV